jgi:hypothetical protein
MLTVLKVLTLLACAFCLYGCTAASSANLTGATPPQETAVAKAEGESSDDDRYYREFCIIKLKTDDDGAEVEVKVKTIKVLLDQLPLNMPYSYLTIKNLKTGAQILREDYKGFPMSIYTLDVNGDQREEVVTIWTAGAVAQQMDILDVKSTGAHSIFHETYRVDAALMNLGDGTMNILVTSSESGTGPFYTERYVWRNGRYEMAGKAPYKDIIDAVEQQFTKTRKGLK